jgi:rhodanese-related sulfurtransferase
MEPTRISAKEANERMERGERIFFVDSRNDKAWAEADTTLPEAIRVPADEVEKHFADIPRDRTVVTYCT